MEEKNKKAEASSFRNSIKQKDILTEKIKNLISFLKEKPTAFLVVTGFSLIFLFWLFSGSEPEQLKRDSQDFKKLEERPIAGVESAVDPRVRWTEELLEALKGVKSELEILIEKKTSESTEELHNVVERLDILEEGYLNTNAIKIEDDKTINSNQSSKPIYTLPPKQLKHVQRVGVTIKKDVKDYITSGAFARAVLLSGTVVGTGASGADSPKPIVMRLVDKAIFSKKLFTEQVKEAILLGSCSGNISSERAECRIDTLSLLNSSGDIIEKHQVEGWVFGEDGRAGIRGVVVDRSSEIARMAVFNGILSGMAQFFQNQATNGVYPISPITGQQNPLRANDSLKAGAYSGVGNALEKLADFAIKRAEQMNPVIVVDSGRVVDVVFRKGVDLMHDSDNQITPIQPPTQTDYSNTTPNRIHGIGDNNYASSATSSSSVTSFSKTSRKTKLQEKFTPDDEYLEEEINKLSSEEGF
ncbi:MAG TPA: TraB/VirB10 family protein [Rickettsia endosymbiont of Omalisus fontisbellaquei]|nr:TraB/VirB10 family protein [Rickettsia endosymbiont of Omalisus fontisbellaquei]